MYKSYRAILGFTGPIGFGVDRFGVWALAIQGWAGAGLKGECLVLIGFWGDAFSLAFVGLRARLQGVRLRIRRFRLQGSSLGFGAKDLGPKVF